jgi:calcineurin-like phosphoesterase family protein
VKPRSHHPARLRLLLVVCCLAAAVAAIAPAAHAADPADPADPVVAAAGDIACDPADPSYNGGAGTATACRMAATSDLLAGGGLDAVLLLGDNQYESGTLAAYQASFGPTWGRFKAITRPAVGNHEYQTSGAAGYFAYFGAAAGDPAQGWYSFDLGAWHLVALNSNCAAVGGCGPGSAQERWLAADLAAHAGRCTLAFWHHPRFSSGPHGSDAATAAFWDDLYAAGADLVLVGHEHVYERFAPQAPSGAADPVRGLRQITVGTGGKNHTGFPSLAANSEARNADTFGVLELTLRPDGYEWRFRPEAGKSFTDAGKTLCHSAFPSRATGFHTLPPCRLVDTRNAAGSAGGPALAAGALRDFPVAGACGVPAAAAAVAANLTVVSPASGGFLEVLPAGGRTGATSAVSFKAGQTRADNALLALGMSGQVTVRCAIPSGTAHFVLDVTGYFE